MMLIQDTDMAEIGKMGGRIELYMQVPSQGPLLDVAA